MTQTPQFQRKGFRGHFRHDDASSYTVLFKGSGTWSDVAKQCEFEERAHGVTCFLIEDWTEDERSINASTPTPPGLDVMRVNSTRESQWRIELASLTQYSTRLDAVEASWKLLSKLAYREQCLRHGVHPVPDAHEDVVETVRIELDTAEIDEASLISARRTGIDISQTTNPIRELEALGEKNFRPIPGVPFVMIHHKMADREEKFPPPPMIWLDVETTGLEPQDVILEIAAIATDDLCFPGKTREIGRFHRVVHYDVDTLTMNNWCREQHSKSGLLEEVSRSRHTLEEVDLELSSWIKMIVSQYYERYALQLVQRHTLKTVTEGKSKWLPDECLPPLAGSTIGFDRSFVKTYMPRTRDCLHYRSVDVSTFRELLRRWYPDLEVPPKSEAHRALPDIWSSLEFALWFRSLLGAGALNT